MYGRTETSDMVYLHDHGKVTKRFTASVLHGTDKCVRNHAFSIKIHEMFMHVVVQPYLKVGKLGMVEVRVDVQSGSHHQQRFKLVQRGADVASEA